MAIINVDKEAIGKQIKNAGLKKKVVITSAVLVVAMIVWTVISFVLEQPVATDPAYTALAEKPFTFRVDTETLALLQGKTTYPDTELAEFPIHVLDESRPNQNRNQTMIRTITGPDAGQIRALGENAADTPTASTGAQVLDNAFATVQPEGAADQTTVPVPDVVNDLPPEALLDAPLETPLE